MIYRAPAHAWKIARSRFAPFFILSSKSKREFVYVCMIGDVRDVVVNTYASVCRFLIVSYGIYVQERWDVCVCMCRYPFLAAPGGARHFLKLSDR